MPYPKEAHEAHDRHFGIESAFAAYKCPALGKEFACDFHPFKKNARLHHRYARICIRIQILVFSENLG
jgi:hypothetical protein